MSWSEEKYNGKIVWNISFNYSTDPEFNTLFPDPPREYSSSSLEFGSGRVDANTGDIVYLIRPSYIWSKNESSIH